MLEKNVFYNKSKIANSNEQVSQIDYIYFTGFLSSRQSLLLLLLLLVDVLLLLVVFEVRKMDMTKSSHRMISEIEKVILTRQS